MRKNNQRNNIKFKVFLILAFLMLLSNVLSATTYDDYVLYYYKKKIDSFGVYQFGSYPTEITEKQIILNNGKIPLCDVYYSSNDKVKFSISSKNGYELISQYNISIPYSILAKPDNADEVNLSNSPSLSLGSSGNDDKDLFAFSMLLLVNNPQLEYMGGTYTDTLTITMESAT